MQLINFIKDRKNWNISVLILSISLTLSYLYFNEVIISELNKSIRLHTEIVTNTAYSPYQYRIIVPYTLNGIILIASKHISYALAFKLTYLVFFFLSTIILFSLFFYFFRQFYDRIYSYFGILIIAATIPIALRDHYFQPWSILESILFVLGLILIYKDKFFPLAITIAFASLNRETAVFIPIAYLFANQIVIQKENKKIINKKVLSRFLILTSIWVLIFIGLRFLLPTLQGDITIKSVWAFNSTRYGFLKAIINISIFLGFFWFYTFPGFKKSPEFIRRASFVIPCYILAVLIFGMWYEVRLLIILYPLLIPFILSQFKVLETSSK